MRVQGAYLNQARNFSRGGSLSPAAQALATAGFFAPLKSSLILTRGTGNPTYTRATPATFSDFEARLVTAISGEPRFTGARRVQNLINSTSSEDATTWTKDAGTTVTLQADGSYKVVIPATVFNGITPASGASVPVNSGARGSLWLKADAPTTVYLFTGNGGGVVVDILSVTTSWQRFAGTVRTALVVANMTLTLETAGRGANPNLGETTIYVGGAGHGAQLEDVTGQANQNPSEYVSVGVAAAPYHGAGVDGVKYFSTLNGNTVASNVVTEATGAAIVTGASGVSANAPVDAGGPYGYLAEGVRTNLCLQSQTFGTTWVVPAGSSISADAVVAPDGTTTADKIQESDTSSAIRYITQDITLTVASYTMSVYAKAAERSFILLQASGATNNYRAYNLGTGAVGTTTNGTDTATITALPGGWYRCTMTFTAAASVFACRVWVSNLDSIDAYVGVVNSGAYAWGAQLEAASFATSYIPTTTVAVTRNADVLTYPSAGNLNFSAGTAYAEISLAIPASSQRYILNTDDNSRMFQLPVGQTTTTIWAFDGTNELGKSGLKDMSTGVRKRAVSWGGAGLAITGDGAAPATSAFDGTFGAGTTINVGHITGGGQIYGNIGNVRIWQTQLPDAILKTLTA